MLFRNRRHWKDRGQECIRVGSHRIGFNRDATRWLGVWIDSRLSFRENTSRFTARARKAEIRLASFVRRNGVPPLSARHLQEAIVGSTFMYGTEVTWRGQRFMTDKIQKTINRMTSASLGVLRSTPVSFLQSVGGSMPAETRLRFRQACYAGRLAGSESSEIQDITRGNGELAQRLRSAISRTRPQGTGEASIVVERTFTPGGLRFPGLIETPSVVNGEEEKEQRKKEAVRFANDFAET